MESFIGSPVLLLWGRRGLDPRGFCLTTSPTVKLFASAELTVYSNLEITGELAGRDSFSLSGADKEPKGVPQFMQKLGFSREYSNLNPHD
tara:strand:- start:107 stop:376 length:270 start_codon:yes stop_codon:yes gene_type:complete